MSAALPPPMPTNPLRRVAKDVRRERAATVPFPPGELRPSMARTRRVVVDPLPLLLSAYERYGPVFRPRSCTRRSSFLLGPEANHHLLVSNAKNFLWREGSFRDLIPLLGDSLLTTDGLYHKTARRLMLPAFHTEKVAETVDTMIEEIDHTLDRLGRRRDARRRLRLDPPPGAADRDARAARASTPTRARTGTTRPTSGRPALGYYGRDLLCSRCAARGTPWAPDAHRPRPARPRWSRRSSPRGGAATARPPSAAGSCRC